jgi:hypothetical protein
MALPNSGPISLEDIRAEFGGTGAIDLFDYYRGGANVLDHIDNQSIPTSGPISLFDFRGTSALPEPLYQQPASVGPTNGDTASASRAFGQEVVVTFYSTDIFPGNYRVRISLTTGGPSPITVNTSPQTITVPAGSVVQAVLDYTGLIGEVTDQGPSIVFEIGGVSFGTLDTVYFGEGLGGP